MAPTVEIVVTGRDVPVREHLELHAVKKLSHLERFDRDVVRYEVELNHEQNPRQSGSSYGVTITGHGKGTTLRAEGRGADPRTALDDAIVRVEGQLRRRHDRHQMHHRDRPPAAATDPA